jgi:uncharacterized membrane protein (UPF0127 family)
MTWLVRDDDVLAVAEVAASRGQRTRGLMGRDEFEGALVIRPCRQVHTFGMRFPIDVAFCDRSGTVLHLSCLAPRRMSRVVWHSAFVIEARTGSFERWKLRPGDVVELKG